MDLLGNSRWMLAAMLALATSGAVGCATPTDDNIVSGEDQSSKDDITQVDHTKVKRQSIGNCWLYATTSWLEAMNKAATGEERDTSESWLTYWHWFEQIANGNAGDEISTGGSYSTAADLILRYGLMNEADFIPSEKNKEMSARQDSALKALNTSLKEGALSEPSARRDRALVRGELDRAWGLSNALTKRIDSVFGRSVQRTLDRSPFAVAAAARNKVIPPSAFEAKLKDPQTGEFVIKTLADAVGQSNGWWYPREGAFAWQEVSYPRNMTERRAFWKRVQAALHDEQPVITSWKVDFNALTRDSKFSKSTLDERGPGSQGGHMTVMHDYQAEVPSIGLLKAGEQATPEQMAAALADDTKIQFVRVKNSWGGIRPDRWDDAVVPGYHDLEMEYLDGPIQSCVQDDLGRSDLSNCYMMTPLWDVVLPAGY